MECQPKICIVGCGFGGLCAASKLKKELNYDNFTIFDMNPEIGGTWYSNNYPGASSDGPIHLYSFSFEPKNDWKQKFATQPQIQNYLKDICEKYNHFDKIRLNHQVLSIRFEMSKSKWLVTHKNLNLMEEIEEQFNIVILATGILRNPKIPEEFKNFKGQMFHSAQWDINCELKDKIVAVVGVGASGIQIIPEVAKKAKKLIVYQRRASWMLPKKNKTYNVFTKLGFKFFPCLQRNHRISLNNNCESSWQAFTPGSEIAAKLEEEANEFRESELKGFPKLAEDLKPKDSFGCQRLLFSSNYYSTLKQPNVNLVTFKSLQVKENDLIADNGESQPIDVLILATGFKTEEYFSPIKVWDTQGINLLDKWNVNGPSLLYGITGHNLANMFFLWGPNTVSEYFPQSLSY